MKNIGQGHLVFAVIFIIVFLAGIIYAYRKDLKSIKGQYKKIWFVIVIILVLYFTIFFLNRIT